MELKTYIAIKELYSFDSIEASLESVDLFTQANTDIIQSIYDSKPELGEGEVFIETLSIKILLATRSILELGKGTNISALTKESNVILVDFPSINIITRSIIEAFLTLDYLFGYNLEKEEKIFRFHIWQMSGYKARQKFFENRESFKNSINEKLSSELSEIHSLLSKIEQSPHYKSLDKQHLWKLDKYGLPRLASWQQLLERSILKSSVFETPYKLYSNYAHSEFISLIQMRGNNSLKKDSKENNDAFLNSLRLVKMINCANIVFLKNKFEFAEKVFENFDEETKTSILFWNEFGTEERAVNT